MAVGNESDLVVRISVNTEEVRSGFEKIASMADDLVRDVESRISKLDFSRVFDASKISSSLTAAVSEVTKRIKPIEIRTKVKVPTVPKGKVVSEGGMAYVDAVRERVRGKSVEAKESKESKAKAKSEEEGRVRIISKYVSALNEQARALERVKDLQYELSKADKEKQPQLYASIQSAIALWQGRADSMGSRASGIADANKGNSWFGLSERVAETKEAIKLMEAEKNVSREKRRQADEAAAKARAEREALACIAAATQLYRIASRIVSRVVSAFMDWIDVSNEIYQSQLKLGAALRVGYDVTNGQVRAAYAMVESLSKANGLSLEMNYSAAQMMASYVGTSDELESMMGPLDDLVVKMYGFNANSEQARMVAKQLGRALSGNVDILQRQGIVLTDNEKAMLKSSAVERAEKIKVLTAAIARVTGDMSQEYRTWAGVMGRIRVYAEITKNNFGEALQNSLKPMLDVILGIAKGLAAISEWSVNISKFAFGNNIKGAEELSRTIAGLSDELDDLQTRLLGFDKFNVLSGSDAGNSSPLGGEAKKGGGGEVGKSSGGLSDVGEFFSEITGASGLLKVALTGIGVALGTIVTLSGALMAAGFIAKLKNLISTLNLANAGISITKGNLLGLTAGITLLITGVTTLISTFDNLNDWDKLTGWQKATTIFRLLVGSVMTVVGGLLTASSAVKIFGDTAVASFLKARVAALKLCLSTNAVAAAMVNVAVSVAALAALVGGIVAYATAFNDMSNAAKVLVPVIAIITALTAAIIAWKVAQAGPLAIAQAAMIAGGIALAVGSMISTVGSAKKSSVSAFADGGLPDKGQLFIANESGPELVGNIGGRTSVANNAMIVEAIEEAAYRGFSRAQGEGGANNVTLTLQGDGVRNDALVRALMPALKTEIKRQGGIKKAFGE